MSMDNSGSPTVSIEAEVNIDNRKWFGLFNFTHNKGRFRKWYEEKKSNRSNKQSSNRLNRRRKFRRGNRAKKKVFFFRRSFIDLTADPDVEMLTSDDSYTEKTESDLEYSEEGFFFCGGTAAEFFFLTGQITQ